MATGIFKGPKGALIFVGVTMASVALLVGTEEDSGALVAAADELSRNSSADNIPARDASRLPQPAPRPARRRPPASTQDDSALFASDEELIDDASGFDPSPDLPQPFDTGPSDAQAFDTRAASGDVTVIESYGPVEIR